MQRPLIAALWWCGMLLYCAHAETIFNRDIRPILYNNCISCHGPDEEHRKADLRLDVRDTALEALAPGNRASSEVWARLTASNPEDLMPPASSGHALTEEQIRLLGQWIDDGAPYAAHWSFIAPDKASIPNKVKNLNWAEQPWDRFIQNQLELAGLPPSELASRATLLRRVSLDLRGLPPSLDEVARFENETHREAFAREVDRLLASPAYGERWARVWLDLARYADSRGYGSDPLRKIWRYRDWVIDAFNQNRPFDDFTVEQLAGDLLDEPSTDEVLATAFHRNTLTNTLGGTIDEEFRVLAVKDRLDTTSQVWMGLTMRCAQCHNHKFDPISQKEYYQMYAFFNQTADTDRPDEFPTASTPSLEEQRQLEALREERLRLEQVLSTPDEASARRQADWEKVLRAANEEGWTSVRRGPGKATVDLQGATAFRVVLSEGNQQMQLKDVVATLVSETPPLRGRYVRLEHPGNSKIIHIAELEVYSAGKNVALSGNATQSSTGSGGKAARGIDGKTDGRYTSNTTTHTGTESNPWWEVDLQQMHPLEKLVLWNRTDGNLQRRLDGAQLIVLDQDRREVWRHTLAKAPDKEAILDLGGPRSLPVLSVTSSHKDANLGWRRGLHQGPVDFVFALDNLGDGFGTTVELDWKLEGQWLENAEISLTKESVLAQALTKNLQVILGKSIDQRSNDEPYVLAKHFRALDPELGKLRQSLAKMNKRIKEFKTTVTPVMRELPADKQRKSHVMVKGNYLVPGESVQAELPKAFPSLPKGESMNRLGLARWLVARDNPLTARVTVNRLWGQLFGRGLVETQEDFGTQGTFPSHPDLLDWLAVDFMDREWDQKSMLRTLVTSMTYRQTSKVSAIHLEKDPDNRLLGRGPRFRLEAEMVRDQALAVSGLLTHKMHGPSVYPPQPEGLWRAAFNGERKWATSVNDDRYRRGLYIFLRRSVPYPSMATFDAPNREICVARRISTNTPLQAFVTLNDPAYVEMAQALARRMVHAGGETLADQLAHGLKLARLETPQVEQIAALQELHESELKHYQEHLSEARALAEDPLNPLPKDANFAKMAALTVVANVLLNLDAVMMKY